MKRLAALAVVLAVLAPAGAAAKGPWPVYGLEWRLGGGVTFARYDARTLKPLAGPRLDLGDAANVLARSPDGTRLAVGGAAFVRIADLRTGRLSRKVWIGGWATRSRTLWARPDRLVLAGADEVIVIDPRASAVLSRRPTGRDLIASVHRAGTARLPARLVLLLAPPDAIGRLTIGVLDSSGRLRTAPVGLRGGARPIENDEGNLAGMHQETPGLAVDPRGTRALVAGRASVAVVDLATLGATVHALALRTTQKVAEGWWRRAEWLAATRAAVYGSDFTRDGATEVPVQIVDLTDWTARPLEVKAPYAVRSNGLLVAVGRGLTALDATGSTVYTAAAERTSGLVVASGGFVYAETTGRGRHWVVLDAFTGDVLARRTFRRPTEILGVL